MTSAHWESTGFGLQTHLDTESPVSSLSGGNHRVSLIRSVSGVLSLTDNAIASFQQRQPSSIIALIRQQRETTREPGDERRRQGRSCWQAIVRQEDRPRQKERNRLRCLLRPLQPLSGTAMTGIHPYGKSESSCARRQRRAEEKRKPLPQFNCRAEFFGRIFCRAFVEL